MAQYNLKQKGTVFSEDQKVALKAMLSGKNVFLTGKAGTGKTHIVKEFLKQSGSDTIITAPTGIAALAIHGATLHSVFRLRFGLLDPNAIEELPKNQMWLIRKAKTLIIDEISMVRADAFEAIYRKIEKCNTSLQIIVVGDFYQLPPVVRKEEIPFFREVFGGFFAFNSPAWKEARFTTCELTTVHRQNDMDFINVLNQIRIGDPSGIPALAKRVGLKTPECATVLVTTNKMADAINGQKIAGIKAASHVFEAAITGEFEGRDAPCPFRLEVKTGASVIACVNDSEGRFVNGSVGLITEIKKGTVSVDFGDGPVTVEPHTWEIIDYQYDSAKKEVVEAVRGSFKQLPIRLGFALTVHRCQGMSIKNVAIDLGFGSFSHGQTYTALSRATSIEGLTLVRPIKNKDLIVDRAVVAQMAAAVHKDSSRRCQ